MPAFQFKAYDRDGGTETGEVFARDAEEVLDQLSGRGLVPFDVRERKNAGDLPFWAREITLTGDLVPRQALAEFLQSFSLLLKAKLSVPAALSSALGDVRHKRLRTVLAGAERQLREGGGLASALSAHESVIPGRITALVELGEEANRLPETMGYAAELMARELAFRAELKGALTYPIVLLIAALAVVFGLVFLLAPTLAPVFAAVGAEPPWIIATMLWTRDSLIAGGMGLVATLGALALGLGLMIRNQGSVIERITLALPFFGGLRRDAEALKAVMTLGLILKSGAPLLAALGAAKEASSLILFRDLLEEIEESVRRGGRIGEVISDTRLMPSPVIRMIRVGEDADALPEMLESATGYLDGRLRQKVQSGLRLVTPVLTLVIGTLVGALIFTTLSAILEINDLAF